MIASAACGQNEGWAGISSVGLGINEEPVDSQGTAHFRRAFGKSGRTATQNMKIGYDFPKSRRSTSCHPASNLKLPVSSTTAYCVKAACSAGPEQARQSALQLSFPIPAP